MPKMIIKSSNVPLTNKDEAADLASDLGATSYQSSYTGTYNEYDITFRFDSLSEGNNALSMLGEEQESYIEYGDGTIGRHYIRYERNDIED